MSTQPTPLLFFSLGNAWPLIFDAALKGFFILAVIWGILRLRPRASAATRHLLWFLGLLSLPCLLLLPVLLPAWPVLPQWMDFRLSLEPTAQAANSSSIPIATMEGEIAPPNSAGAETKAAVEQQPAKRGSIASSAELRLWTERGWLAGMLLSLLPLVLGTLSLCRLGRRSTSVDDPAWGKLLESIAEELGLSARVRLLVSEQRQMPMTWGIFSPRLLLPKEALDWKPERRRNVLLHELAHVKRHDCVVHLLARCIVAVFWFNPLAWLAARKLATEQERACDDLALRTGINASEYAEQLLQIASGVSPAGKSPFVAIAMARPSALEGRLLAILEPQRNRHPLERLSVIAVAMLLACLIVPIAMVRGGETKEIGNAAQPGGKAFTEPGWTNSNSFTFTAPAQTNSTWKAIYNLKTSLPPAQPIVPPAPSAALGAKIQFAKLIHDFGKITAGETAKCEFVFTNTGNAVLEVSNVRPSCGCTVVGPWSRSVQPGQSGIIPLQFHTANYSGAVTKTATVTCNDSNQPTVILQLKANIWRPIEVTPQLAMMSLTPNAPSNAVEIKIVNHLEQPLNLLKVESRNPAFAVEVTPVQLGKEYQLLVKTVPPYPAGNAQGQIVIETSSTNTPVLNLQVWAMMQPRVSAAPGRIDLPAGTPTLPHSTLPAGTLPQGLTNNVWLRNRSTNLVK